MSYDFTVIYSIANKNIDRNTLMYFIQKLRCHYLQTAFNLTVKVSLVFNIVPLDYDEAQCQ